MILADDDDDTTRKLWLLCLGGAFVLARAFGAAVCSALAHWQLARCFASPFWPTATNTLERVIA